MKQGALMLLFATAAGLICPAFASDSSTEIEDKRAQFNYQLYCQGCHGPTGAGRNGVPQIRDTIGLFLKSQAGREYLIQVPGAANSPLDDRQLAGVTNWAINRFGGTSVPTSWQAYSDAEVAEYRKQPLLEVLRYRQELLNDITATNN